MANLSIKGGSELEVYARLIRALLPRMRGMSIIGLNGELHWSTEIAVDEPMRRMVLQSMQVAGDQTDAPGMLIDDSEPSYVMWLRSPGAAQDSLPFAAVVLRCLTGSETETRSLLVVHSLLRPVLEILSRELLSYQQVLTLRSELAGHNQDLDMLLTMSGSNERAEVGGGDELKTILRAATEHVLGGLAAIIVPEKGLVLVQQAAGNTMDANLVARAHRHLMSTAQIRQRAVVVNHMQHPSGSADKAYRLMACPIARQDGRTIGVLALFRTLDKPEFTLRQARLAELLARRVSAVIAASYDALTGLMNRPAFEKRVQIMLRADRAGGRTWSALAIDTNRTHVINDTFGMHIGDRVIAQIGELIRARLPPGAVAARISGDRFAVLVRAGLDDAARFAEALRSGAESLGAAIAVGVGETAVTVSISVGIAAVEAHVEEFTHAFAAAETACKAANDRGRNRVEIFREADESIIRRYTDINLVTDLRGAIATGRLCLNAQMLLPLGSTHQRPHFELLLRMIGPDGQTVGPDSFMSAALRYQLMPEIDRWVVGEALRLLQPHAALLAQSPVVFTINCSGQSLRDEAFTHFLVESITASGINPQALCFELTESAAVGNLANAETLMLKLRKLGCGLALDDFGTGLSSLSYLRSLPITMLKIDGSFVRDVLRDPKAEFTIKAIAQLARSMNLITVAEYVETDEIRLAVTRLGVDYAQGFAIDRPVPIAEVLEQLPLYAAIADGARDESSACAIVGTGDPGSIADDEQRSAMATGTHA
jgi:diguanylate cyclase (GGDEF)-like protein